MAKKSKSRRVKRILNVKIPKPVGRFLARPSGRYALAGTAIAGGVAVVRNPQVQAAFATAATEIGHAVKSAGYAIGSAARSALEPMIAAAQAPMDDGAEEEEKKPKKGKSSGQQKRGENGKGQSHRGAN